RFFWRPTLGPVEPAAFVGAERLACLPLPFCFALPRLAAPCLTGAIPPGSALTSSLPRRARGAAFLAGGALPERCFSSGAPLALPMILSTGLTASLKSILLVA